MCSSLQVHRVLGVATSVASLSLVQLVTVFRGARQSLKRAVASSALVIVQSGWLSAARGSAQRRIGVVAS